MSYIPTNIPISQIIKQTKNYGIFDEAVLTRIEVSADRFGEAEEDVRQRLNVKLITGKYSEVLIGQLARHKLQIYERFGNEIHHYHMPGVLEVIESVEKNKTANIRPFNRKPLAGMLHAHHNSNSFPGPNMLRHWKQLRGSEDEITFQNRLLKKLYFELLEDFESVAAHDKALSILLQQIYFGSKKINPENLTGEWIIFKEHDDIKYFLCLATHQEARDFSDEVIFERIKPCLVEFPEIFI